LHLAKLARFAGCPVLVYCLSESVKGFRQLSPFTALDALLSQQLPFRQVGLFFAGVAE